MNKRKTVWRRTMMTFLLIGTILAQMIAGVGIGETVQASAEETQSLEDYIVSRLKDGAMTIDVFAYQIPRSEQGEIDKVLMKHQELFYVAAGYQCWYALGNKGKEVVEIIIPSYTVHIKDNAEDPADGYTMDELAVLSDRIDVLAGEAAACAEPGMKPYEKVLAVHDYLAQNCRYDEANFQAGTIPAVSHTTLGALVNRQAVCEGYARAFLCIMNKLDIPCRLVVSDSMRHMWNMVQLDGKWYHVDVTWDDPVWDCIGRVYHDHFLVSDRKISQDHYSWVVKGGDVTADSDTYDEAFWTDIRSGICFYNGGWYYSKYQKDGRNSTTAIKLVRRESLLDGAEKIVDTAPAWAYGQNSYLTGSYMYLAKSGEYLYYNTSTEIRRLSKDGTVTACSLKDELGNKQIFGFTVLDGQLVCAPYESYSTSVEQKDLWAVTATDEDFKPVGNNDQAPGETKKPNTSTIPYTTKAQDTIKKSGTTTVKTPKISYKVKGNKLTVKYTAPKNAAGFQVRYKLGKGKWKVKTYYTAKSVSKKIGGLKKGKYKVQVRSFTKGKKVFSKWSKAKTIKVKKTKK